jgi:hypothetical protein
MRKLALLFVPLALATTQTSFGSPLCFQGFETATSDGFGAGALLLSSADGSYYAQVTNSPSACSSKTGIDDTPSSTGRRHWTMSKKNRVKSVAWGTQLVGL